MAVTTAMCNSFKQELLNKEHDMNSDTFKIALINGTNNDYNKATTNYSDVTGGAGNDEASGTNYSAGGGTLANPVIALTNDTAHVSFDDEVFSNVTCSAIGALIYNSSASNKAVCTINFGGTVSAVAGDLTIDFPDAGESTSIIRIS
jgi:hypothetical protein